MKPPAIRTVRDLQAGLVVLAAAVVVAALYAVFFVAPREATLGISQKIFYFHVASAIQMMLMFGVCGLCGLVYLVRAGSPGRLSAFVDSLAVATAEVGVTLGAVVLTTGPLWARKAWGTWWTWEPRLTLSLMVFLLFLAYLALRAFVGNDRFGRGVASGLAVVGLPGLYFIHFAVERWGGAHPQVIFRGGLQVPEMKIAFAWSIAAMFLVSWMLVVFRLRLERIRRALDDLYLEVDRREV